MNVDKNIERVDFLKCHGTARHLHADTDTYTHTPYTHSDTRTPHTHSDTRTPQTHSDTPTPHVPEVAFASVNRMMDIE